MNESELRDGLAYVESELRSIDETAGDGSLDDETQARFNEGVSYVTDTRAQIEAIEARKAELAKLADKPEHVERIEAPEVIVRKTGAEVLEDRNAGPLELADGLTRSLEAQGLEGDRLGHVRSLALKHKADTGWSRQLIARSQPVYADAFTKILQGTPELLTPEESRAMSVGTDTAGGFLVPTHLDPTIILTSDGSANAIRAISRQETLTAADGNTWYGITSAGISASWDSEAGQVSDDSPAVAAPSVPLYRAQAYAMASYEALQDTNIAGQLGALFADARNVLEGAAHATGSGSSQPTGIFTAIDANTNQESESTTANTVGLVDLQKVYRTVPVRFRGMSTWVMNPLHLGNVQALGTAVSASYSTDITQPYTPRLLGRPVVETDDAPSTQTTTVADNVAILGDFSNFVIVDKPGSFGIRNVPVVIGANNRPTGQAGFYAFWRTGSDSVNDDAFVLLQEKTSA